MFDKLEEVLTLYYGRSNNVYKNLSVSEIINEIKLNSEIGNEFLTNFIIRIMYNELTLEEVIHNINLFKKQKSLLVLKNENEKVNILSLNILNHIEKIIS